jgi:hypothetical protein
MAVSVQLHVPAAVRSEQEAPWYLWRTQEFCSGGGSTNSVEDRGQRERGSGGGSPKSGVPLNLQSGSTLSDFRDVEGCYGCIFHGAGNSAQLCQNFGISGGGC